MPWLTLLIVVPLAAGIVTAFLPAASARLLAAVAGLATAGLAVAVLLKFDRGVAGGQMTEHHGWASDSGLEWMLRIDGVSLWLVMLTAGIFGLALVAGFAHMPKRAGAPYLGLILIAEAALLGLFLAGNLLLFYVFWESMLIPFYFLIGMWGSEGRRRAVMRFVVYTMVGSLMMLVGIVATAFIARDVTGQFTFDMQALQGVVFTDTQSRWLFAAFALAFVIKLPMWPFHAWLPDTYRTAPIVVTVLLAAVMSKAGVYGFLAIGLPLFPAGAAFFQNLLVLLSVVSILYGSLVAWRAPSLRLVIAYSSVAHLGFILLGIVTVDNQAAQGAVLQMVNHGLVVASAFVIVGIITHRSGREDVDELGGLAEGAPWLAGAFLFVTMASLAIPGSNAFAGEFFILIGTFRHHWWAVFLATLGIIYASVYMLRLFQRTMNGPRGQVPGSQVELRASDFVLLVPLVAAMVTIALWPQGVLRTTGPTIDRVLAPAQVALNRPASQVRARVPVNPPEEALPLPGDPEPTAPSPQNPQGTTP